MYQCSKSADIGVLLAQWGNFSDVMVPAKRAKRIGLLFSSMQSLTGILKLAQDRFLHIMTIQQALLLI